MVPSDEQRGYLQRRAALLANAETPLDERNLRIQVQSVLASLDGQAGTPDDAEIVIGFYTTVLRDIPGHAVVAACADYVFGRAGDRKWRPKPAELRSHAQTHAGKVIRERREIDAVLAAKPEPVLTSAENRKAVADMVRGMLPSIEQAGKQAEAERTGEPFVLQEQARPPAEILAEMRDRADEPAPQISSYLRRLLIAQGAITDMEQGDAA